MTANRLTPIGPGKQCAGSRVRLHLVCLGHVSLILLSYGRKTYQHDANVELLGQSCKTLEELAEGLLTLGEFPTAAVVGPEEGNDTVDDEQSIFAATEVECKNIQQLILMLCDFSIRLSRRCYVDEPRC